MQIEWKTLNEVPKVFRVLAGGRLTVDQCNLLYKNIALKHVRTLTDGRTDLDYAKARAEFKATHEKKKIGNAVVWIIRNGNGNTGGEV